MTAHYQPRQDASDSAGKAPHAKPNEGPCPRRSASIAPSSPAMAHRVELLLSLLGRPVELVDVDLRARARAKTPAFLAKNPFGQVPVIEDGDVTLADSTAILVYLALRYDPSGRWLPREPIAAATVQRWLSVASGELAAGPKRGAAGDQARRAARRRARRRNDRDRAARAARRASLEPELPRRRRRPPSPTWRSMRIRCWHPRAACRSNRTRNVRAWHARIEVAARLRDDAPDGSLTMAATIVTPRAAAPAGRTRRRPSTRARRRRRPKARPCRARGAPSAPGRRAIRGFHARPAPRVSSCSCRSCWSAASTQASGPWASVLVGRPGFIDFA